MIKEIIDSEQTQSQEVEPPKTYAAYDLTPVLDESEVTAIGHMIQTDLLEASSDHGKRINRMRYIYELFRKLVDEAVPGEEDAATIRVPLVQWSVFQQAASEFHALFGQGAKIKADPSQGETTNQMAQMVAAFMSWLVLRQMKLGAKLMEFLIYRALFGRAYAYVAWRRDVDTFIGDSGEPEEAVWSDAPDFTPLWPGDVMRPKAENVRSIHEFPWVAVRRHYTVQQLIALEQQGEFHNVIEKLDMLYQSAGRSNVGDWHQDELKVVKDEAAGTTSHRHDSRGTVVVYEYYGSRCLPTQKGHVGETDWARRDLLATEIVVHWCPSINKCFAIHDLKRLHPRQRYRRPLFESAMPFGDQYERQGLGELLHDLEEDMTSNERQFTDQVRLAQGFGFHEPQKIGLPADSISVEAGKSYAVQDATGINWIFPKINFDAFMLKSQQLLSIAERIHGYPDFYSGRTPSQPNAPRTATGQSLMVQQGSVRTSVSLLHLEQDLTELMDYLWALWVNLGDEQTTFRVIESDMLEGQLDRAGNGFAKLTPQERKGRYQFSMKFAPNEVEKQLRKTEASEMMGIALQNPLIATNPAALWEATNEYMQAIGQTWFASRVPRPEDPAIPKNPNSEWAMMLNGMDVKPSPAEDFENHLVTHKAQYIAAMRKAEARDVDAIYRLEQHIIDTEAMADAVEMQKTKMAATIAAAATMQNQQPGAEQKPQGAPNNVHDAE